VSSGNASGAQSGGATKQQRRVLVLTDAPRLLFFDTGAGTVQGALDITGAAPVDLRVVRSLCLLARCFQCCTLVLGVSSIAS
jgi:hypothetical protein